jgi:hypothetical protein
MAKENVLAEVKSLAPHDQVVIALHSPSGLVETGLRICPSEKKAATLAHRQKVGHFSGPVSSRESLNCGVFERLSAGYS